MITIRDAKVLYGDNLEEIRANVLISDGKIVEVSPQASEGKIIDARGCIVAPAFINSHVHLGDSVAMDMGDGKPIKEIVKPPDGIKHRILADTPHSTLIDFMKNSMWEMLKTGTTTFVDFRESGREGINIINKASEEVPIRKIVLGRHESFLDSHNTQQEVIERILELLEICDGIAPSGLGEITDSTASAIAETTMKSGKLSAIHVAEYEQVQNDSLNTTGKTEVQRAIEAGFQLLIHLTSPLKDDLELVAESGTPVVCCSRSNGSLAAGIPPIKDMFEAGIQVLLGTDNMMFNSPNILREMEYTLKITRAYYKEYFPPEEIVKMATVNAGKALNLNTGSITEGKLADLVILEQISSNPYLSIINRTEPGNIKHVIKEGQIIQ